jgi:hypothetical protein
MDVLGSPFGGGLVGMARDERMRARGSRFEGLVAR